jgi:hypothetical protein
MPSSIWVNDASTGTCQLPDGRTCTFNGSSFASLSDGSTIYVGGKGPVSVSDASVTSFSLSASSGASTSASIQVSAFNPAVPDSPSGTVTLYINGVAYSTATLANGQATIAVPASAFSGAGTYNISVQYAGDGNFSMSAAASQPFAFAQLSAPVLLILTPTSGSSTTANVTVNGGIGNPTPTGTVTITIAGTPYITVPLVGGNASPNLPSSAFTTGDHAYAIVAQYNGDATYLAASSSSHNFTYTG